MFAPDQLLAALYEAEVNFVVVGGLAAVAHGSDHFTSDFDCCHARDEENLERLVEALRPFDPRLRGAPDDVPFQWDEKTLRAGSNFTLSTDVGSIDLLGHVSGLGAYEAVEAQSDTLDLYGHPTRVLSLDGLIASKEAAAREKDERMLPELRALRALREKGEPPPEAS
ncbi:MAG: nucleotidyltransferase [Bacteroidetes bacterium QS_8_68_15]|nr:MAG: nucleotidyltransferase [Bacteroidetes bacterium QS_8_68_15]